MAAVVLVRHALPVVRPGVHPVRWRLDEFGRQSAAVLAAALAPSTVLPTADATPVVWSSHEAKAAETAEALADAIGASVRLEPDLREVGRPMEWSATYADEASAYLRDRGRPHWEPPPEVQARVAEAVERAIGEAAPQTPILVTHGLAMSLHVAAVFGIPADRFWADLGYPDAYLVDPDAATLTRLTGGAP